MYCRKCGNKLADGVRFCNKCGTPVKQPAPENIRMRDQEKKHAGQDRTAHGSGRGTSFELERRIKIDDDPDFVFEEVGEKKKKRNVLIPVIIVLIVTLLFLGALAAYIFFDKRNNEAGNGGDEEKTTVSGESGEKQEEAAAQVSDASAGSSEGTGLVEEEAEPSNDSAYEMVDGLERWKKAYIDYINTLPGAGTEMDNYPFYGTFYLNDDDIPEIWIEGSSVADGLMLISYSGGKFIEESFYAGSMSYYKKNNRLHFGGGKSDRYVDGIYTLQNGELKLIEEGEYGLPNDAVVDDGNFEDYYEYFWNGKEMTMDEYNNYLKQVFDFGRATEGLENSYDRNGIIAWLKGDAEVKSEFDNQKINIYELVTGDVTWEEAYRTCMEKGGHLVHINTEEEYSYICDQIVNEGKDKFIFWIGMARVDGQYNYGWVNDNGSIYQPDPELDKYWLAGEPSGKGENANGEIVEENCVDIFYHNSSGRFVFNDVPNDIKAAVPAYSGKIGYICEYEQN